MLQKYRRFIGAALVLAAACWLLRKGLIAILGPVTVSLAVAWLLKPLQRRLARKMGEGWAALAALLLPAGAAVGLAAAFLPFLLQNWELVPREASAIALRIQAVLTRVGGMLKERGMERVVQLLEGVDVGQYVETGLRRSVSAAARLVGEIPTWFSVPFLCWYFMKDTERFINAVTYLFPKLGNRSVKEAMRASQKAVAGYLWGQVTASGSVGLLTAAGLWAVGVPYAAVLGAAMGLFNLIPYFGQWICGAVVLATALPAGKALPALAVTVVVQQLESAVITPGVVGKKVSLHPAAVLVAILAGGYAGGLVGLIAAVPVLLIARILFNEWFKKRVRLVTDRK